MSYAPMLRALLTLCLLIPIAPSPAAAQTLPDDHDIQVWMQALAIGPLSPNWRIHLEAQPRVFDNGSELGLTIVRTAIGRQLTPRISLWGGYAWVPRSLGPRTTHEQRSWQQLSLSLPAAGGWTPSARIRLEQRWLEPWTNASHRLRMMARVQRPLVVGAPWHVAFYDEAMVTLDTTARGPFKGYDRNRLFSGLGRRLTPSFTLEAGYLWENSTIRGPRQRNDHVALTTLNITWPRRR